MAHINNSTCPSCTDMLKEAHPRLVQFAIFFRSQHLDAHISCAHRDAAAQQQAFDSGHSKAKPGQSKHNTSPAEALDWFRLTQSGGANFDSPWYQSILAPAAKKAGLVWGGDWHSIKDLPHVELPKS